MPRKVGAIMTQLKERAAEAERAYKRLLVRVQALEAENRALKEKIARKEGEPAQ